MNKTKKILAMAAPLFILAGCYDQYVLDYDYSAVYVANQYDLRTLVVGEGMKFDFGVVLGGVMNNSQDRTIRFEIDDELVNREILRNYLCNDYEVLCAADGTEALRLMRERKDSLSLVLLDLLETR